MPNGALLKETKVKFNLLHTVLEGKKSVDVNAIIYVSPALNFKFDKLVLKKMVIANITRKPFRAKKFNIRSDICRL